MLSALVWLGTGCDDEEPQQSAATCTTDAECPDGFGCRLTSVGEGVCVLDDTTDASTNDTSGSDTAATDTIATDTSLQDTTAADTHTPDTSEPDTNTTDTGSMDTSDVEPSTCTPLDFAAVSVAGVRFADDVGVGLSAYNAASTPFDGLLIDLIGGAESQPSVNSPGTYTLGTTAAERNFATCGTCVLLLLGCVEGGCESEYLAVEGTLDVFALSGDDAPFGARLTGVVLEEITIDGTTLNSTFVPDGRRYCLSETTIESVLDGLRHCVTDEACPADAPACNSDGFCTSCTTNAHCPSSQPVCDTSGQVEACVECVSNADCVGHPDGDQCDLATKTCFDPSALPSFADFSASSTLNTSFYDDDDSTSFNNLHNYRAIITDLGQGSADGWTEVNAALVGTGAGVHLSWHHNTNFQVSTTPQTIPVRDATTSTGSCLSGLRADTEPSGNIDGTYVNFFGWDGGVDTPVVCGKSGSVELVRETGTPDRVKLTFNVNFGDGSTWIDKVFYADYRHGT